MVLIASATGFCVGPQTFQAKDAPNYTPAKIILVVCMFIEVCSLLAARTIFVYRNKKKAAVRAGPQYERALNVEFLDLTDKINPGTKHCNRLHLLTFEEFVYVL